MTPRPPRRLPKRRRTFVFDCEALSKVTRGDATLGLFVKASSQAEIRVVTSALTLLEAWDPRAGARAKAWDWTLSRIEVVYLDEALTSVAQELLTHAGLHGHKYASDSVLAAVALQCVQRGEEVAVLTSDADDMKRLLGAHPIRIEPV
ncbi:hypothetical protein [Streptomyces sp. H34-S4]|uniref:hypothetical protein n=1 Tax=Streptomyces sp. H34-S4 TaxID=2996463 RepID=UPI00226E9CE4|nr:hypothetical protein [Streptomyces sp. H34-S4]MCY0939482.1 hypothetical protein [Streptomyces sp. H34-S4]